MKPTPEEANAASDKAQALASYIASCVPLGTDNAVVSLAYATLLGLSIKYSVKQGSLEHVLKVMLSVVADISRMPDQDEVKH